jgi:hypothetical protein
MATREMVRLREVQRRMETIKQRRRKVYERESRISRLRIALERELEVLAEERDNLSQGQLFLPMALKPAA